jgi:hypothetical protein
MKNYLKNFALLLVCGFVGGLLFQLFTIWQACVLIFSALVAFFVYRELAARLEVLSRQLSNLYVLTAWKSVPSEELDSEDGSPPTTSMKSIDLWEKFNEYRFIGDGMLADQASLAAFDKRQKYWLEIARDAPSRIKNRCNKRSFSSEDTGKPLCPTCAEAYAEAEKELAGIQTAIRKRGVKRWKRNNLPRPFISEPLCPLPKTFTLMDKDGYYVTCECGFEKRGLGLNDALLEEKEHAITHDPALRLSRPDGGQKMQEQQISPLQR